MNVSLSQGGIGASSATGAGKAVPAGATAPVAARGAPTLVARHLPTAARRADFTAQQEQLNRQTTYAQRAIAFLDGASQALQELKGALGAGVARRAPGPAALETSLARMQAHWQTRHAATGGALGPDLAFHDDGGARQAFRIQALDLPSLRSGQRETLTVYPRGLGKLATVLAIDAQPRSDREWTRRVDHALAASGIEAALADDRELTLHARENRWNELRGQLMIQGEGHRFPASRPSQAHAEAIAAPIDPSVWSIGDTAQRRQTLRHTVRAIEQVQLVRDGLQRTLQDNGVALRVERQRFLSDSEASKAAEALAALLGQAGDFQRFATIGAALRGLNGQRVRAVSA